MGTKNYKFRFYINARHFVVFNGVESKRHPHTWEVVVHLEKESIDLVKFSNIEKNVNDYFVRYHDRLLNDMHPFDLIMPTMENMGVVFYKDIRELLESSGWELEKLEISENPTRTFVLNDQSALDFIELNESKEKKKSSIPWAEVSHEQDSLVDATETEAKSAERDNVREKIDYWADVHKSIEERMAKRKKHKKKLYNRLATTGIVVVLLIIGILAMGGIEIVLDSVSSLLR